MNVSGQTATNPVFVKEKEGTGSAFGVKESYANIKDIASIEKVGQNHWQGYTFSGKKIECGENAGDDVVYHFDDNGAKQIINYLA